MDNAEYVYIEAPAPVTNRKIPYFALRFTQTDAGIVEQEMDGLKFREYLVRRFTNRNFLCHVTGKAKHFTCAKHRKFLTYGLDTFGIDINNHDIGTGLRKVVA